MRTLVLLLVLFGPLALWSADWYSVRLLANPIVQPVELPVAGGEVARPILVKTGEGIRRLDIDSSVRYVPARAFESSTDLRVVSFEGRVRRIGNCAFAGATNLTDIVLHEATSVLVASNAFAGCSQRLACVYPFSPVMTAQDGAAQSGAPIFPRVLFLRGEDLKNELSNTMGSDPIVTQVYQ